MSIDPSSSCELLSPGMKVIVSVVSSDSTRFIMAMRPAEVSTTLLREMEGEATVKFALAFEDVEVVTYRAEALYHANQHRKAGQQE
jgi:hypothetical protein